MTLVVLVFSSLLLMGCAVGPNYKQPQVQVPKQWTVAPAHGTSTRPLEKEEWWSSFQDPELNSLVAQAVARNLDLKLALERVQEARATSGVARSGYFPSIDADVSAARLRGGINQGVIRAVPSSIGPNVRASLISPFETNVFQGNLGASWELDVFGGVRRPRPPGMPERYDELLRQHRAPRRRRDSPGIRLSQRERPSLRAHWDQSRTGRHGSPLGRFLPAAALQKRR